MSAYNHVTLVGTLAQDPVTTKKSKSVTCKMTIGCERYAGKNKPVEVDYFNITTTGKLAEIASEYLKKDKKILVDGTIQVTMKEDNAGKRTWITEVIAENIKFLRTSTEIKENVNNEASN